MPTINIVLLVALGLILVLVTLVLYRLLKIRDEFAEHRAVLVRAVAIVNSSQKVHSQLVSLLQRLESVSDQPQTGDLKQLEEQIGRLSERVEGLAHNAPEGAPVAMAAPVAPVKPRPSDQAVMRRETLSQDPKLRFNILKEWAEKNSLAILRLAVLGWKSADDLITIVPPSLEPEAEILDDLVLLLGTHGHADRLAIALRDLSSEPEVVNGSGRPTRHLAAAPDEKRS
jgi:hypothetical protein